MRARVAIPSEDLEHNHGKSEPKPFYHYEYSLLFILLRIYPLYNVRIVKMKKLNSFYACRLFDL